MRMIRLLIAFACIALGAVVGALNRQLTTIDFGALQVSTTLGVALLVALRAQPIAKPIMRARPNCVRATP